MCSQSRLMAVNSSKRARTDDFVRTKLKDVRGRKIFRNPDFYIYITEQNEIDFLQRYSPRRWMLLVTLLVEHSAKYTSLCLLSTDRAADRLTIFQTEAIRQFIRTVFNLRLKYVLTEEVLDKVVAEVERMLVLDKLLYGD